ncbi:methyl-accepting chemotaxis protein [Propionivibrio limicola]|uniref:methyl-accepting chemotaxis protein n=1 Tax=Propionivibrio limicola TaxID=167645 RepID=UPI001FE39FAF|nr:methyl-accepting chemotaxis protein [Propionivibrio limicola]
MKLKTKIALLVVAALLGLISLVVYSAIEMRQQLIGSRQAVIRSVLESTHATLTSFQAKETAGELTREEAQKAAAEAIGMIRYGGKDGKAEYVYSFTTEGVGVYHVIKERIGQNMLEKIRDPQGNYTWKDILATVQKNPGGEYLTTLTARPGQKDPVPKLGYVKLFEPWAWVIGTGVYIDDINAEFQKRLLTDLAIAALLIALIGSFGFAIARGVLRQVGGEPAEAIGFMSRAAAGDLTGTMPAAPKGSMVASMGDMVLAIRQMLAEIGQEATKLARDAEKISIASNEVSKASQSQNDATQSMAAAIEQMTVSVKHISDSADETEHESSAAVELAATGFSRIQAASQDINTIATTVSDASERIRKLEDHANQISSIAGVIKEIAGQTNLLALNAAIEAARAGEQGRGFAVVADEVRKLAERTSSATVEIEQMIAGIQTDTQQVVGVMDAALPQVDAGVKAAEEAAESLRQIKEGAQSTLHRIREVADATREQSVASSNIAQRVEQISQMVEETSSTMQATAETATDLEKISSDLNKLVSCFRC